MRYRIWICSLLLIAAVMTGVFCLTVQHNSMADSTDVTLWTSSSSSGESVKYIYVVGGYHDPDNGATWPWGDTGYPISRFIGNNMGDIEIQYADGSKDTIPLVYGYTLWWYDNWRAAPLPFKGKGADETLSQLLQETLHVYGAYNGNPYCAIRIKPDQTKALKDIVFVDNPEKEGKAVIHDVHVFDSEPSGTIRGTSNGNAYKIRATDEYFMSHTIDSTDPFPERISEALDTLCLGVATSSQDWLNAPEYTYSDKYTGPKIYFTGTPYANIANGVIDFSLTDIATRADDTGFFGESLKYTEQYFYGGIGTYTMGGAYYTRMYSRNKTMLVLNGYGYTDRAEHTLGYINRQLMYYPEHNLKIFGIDIPGHFTMDIADPLNYKKTNFGLTKYNDPVKYGKDNWNLANMEQDGHGMMMLSNWSVWKSNGSSKQWVEDNWQYINEAATWIVWCFENADLTYCTNNVLYAESEGVVGWMGYSLYCNEPCYLGLLAYIEMAEVAGKTEEAALWRECAEKFGQGILDFFTNEDGTWNFEYEGKDRDPSLAYMRYLYGYDTADMNQDWLERAKKSYAGDLQEMLDKNDGYWGPWGVGYDHATILQSALLLDKMSDATILMNNLSKVCYDPDAPDVYGVAEAFAVDTKREYVRRVGDFENQIHTTEVLSVYLLSMGVSPVTSDNTTVKIMPRLAADWNVAVEDFQVEHTNARLALDVKSPKNGIQTASIKFHELDTLKTVQYRFGPFDINTESATITVNGENIESDLITSGDSKWAWITLEPTVNTQYDLVATTVVSDVETNNESSFPMYIIVIIACVCVGIAVCVAVIVIKKKKQEVGING